MDPTSNTPQVNQPEIKIPNTPQKKNIREYFNTFRKLFFQKALFFNDKFKLLSFPQKIVVGFVGVLFSLLVFSLPFFAIKNLKNIGDRFSGNESFTNDDKWDRLVLSNRETPFFTLKPSSTNKHGIVPKETFVLTTKEPFSLRGIEGLIESSKPLSITKASDTEFRLSQQRALGIEETLTISIPTKDKEIEGHTFDRDYGWAYQTAPKFRIVGTLPKNQATMVPVNTGIEITFNLDQYTDPSSFISISPKIDYRVEKREETFVIIPLTPLDEKSIYTVTLKKGVGHIDRTDRLAEDLIFSFQTAPKVAQSGSLRIDTNLVQIHPNDRVLAKVYAESWKNEDEVRADIYAFSDSLSFINSRGEIDKRVSWMSYFPENYTVNTKNLSKVSSSKIKLQEQNQIRYLEIPGKLSEGFYLIQFWYDNDKRIEQLWVQSTDIAGYTSIGRDDTTVWLNQMNGKAVSNADVSILGTSGSYTTRDDGVVTFSTPKVLFDNKPHYLLARNHDGKTIVLPTQPFSESSAPGILEESDFWSYLYHERTLYKPGDTVNFWGVVKNRNTNSAPNTLTVNLKQSYIETESLQKKTITPNADGSFIGSFQLGTDSSYWSYITVEALGVEVVSSYFSVYEYEKPDLKVEVTSNKKAIFSDEEVEFKAKVSFFDGTPASSMPLRIRGTHEAIDTELIANQDGEISYTYRPKYSSGNYYPRYEGISITPKDSNEGKLSGYGSTHVYGSRLMIEHSSKQESDKGRLEGTIYNVDLQGINNGSTSNVRGQVVKGQKVIIDPRKIWYEVEKTGTYYDFIEKVTRPTYTYNRHEEILEEKEITTNENGHFSYELNLEENKSYSIIATVRDSENHPETASTYFYYSNEPYWKTNDVAPKAELTIDRESNRFSVGETVKIDITKNGEMYPETSENRFLFVEARRGLLTSSVREEPSYQFNFENKHIPNIYVGAIAFTGKHYEEVVTACRSQWVCSEYYGGYYDNYYTFNGLSIGYKNDDSKLDLSLKTDKATYAPGDSIKLEVEVSKNGNRQAGAHVQLVLIDQALVSMGVVKIPNILTSLYKTVPSLVYYSYYSHKTPLPDKSAAEQGGGGGDREIFKDTPYFDTKISNNDGISTFEFTLPDNLTTWVTYAQAVNNNLDAGFNETSTVVTKDFFVTSHFPRTVLTKDTPNLAVSSFGRSLSNNDAISYAMSIFDGNREVSKETLSGLAFTQKHIPFPKLTSGNFDIRVEGDSGNLKDALRLPLTVSESRIGLELTTTKLLNAGQSMDIFPASSYRTDRPLKLLISDEGKGKYYYDLYAYCYSDSNRVERQLARRLAGITLETRFEDKSCNPQSSELQSFQDENGGIKQVLWGSPVVETSTWATFIDKELFDQEKLKEYFKARVDGPDSSKKDKMYGLWGLALLGEPRINSIRNQTTNSLEEKILSALALVASGSNDEAREIYYDILSTYGYSNKPYIRIQSDEAKEGNYLIDSSLTKLLGSLVDEEYNRGLGLYIRDYRSNEDAIALEASTIGFIDSELATLPDQDTKFTFTSKSRIVEKDFKTGGRMSITLTNDEIKNFNLKINSGRADVIASYFVNENSFDSTNKDNRFRFSRNYKKVSGEGDTIKIGDIVRFSINYEFDTSAPFGCYDITDYTPSGFTHIKNPYAFGFKDQNVIFMNESQPHVMKGCAYHSQYYSPRYELIYYARANASGEYAYESASMQSKLDRSLYTVSNISTIKIDP